MQGPIGRKFLLISKLILKKGHEGNSLCSYCGHYGRAPQGGFKMRVTTRYILKAIRPIGRYWLQERVGSKGEDFKRSSQEIRSDFAFNLSLLSDEELIGLIRQNKTLFEEYKARLKHGW